MGLTAGQEGGSQQGCRGRVLQIEYRCGEDRALCRDCTQQERDRWCQRLRGKCDQEVV